MWRMLLINSLCKAQMLDCFLCFILIFNLIQREKFISSELFLSWPYHLNCNPFPPFFLLITIWTSQSLLIAISSPVQVEYSIFLSLHNIFDHAKRKKKGFEGEVQKHQYIWNYLVSIFLHKKLDVAPCLQTYLGKCAWSSRRQYLNSANWEGCICKPEYEYCVHVGSKMHVLLVCMTNMCLFKSPQISIYLLSYSSL